MVVPLVVDDALDAAEVVDAAGDGDGALLLEAVLLLRRLEQRHEQGVLQVPHGHHKPLLLLLLLLLLLPAAASGPHHAHRHAPLGRHRRRRRRPGPGPAAAQRRRRVLLLQPVNPHGSESDRRPIDPCCALGRRLLSTTCARRCTGCRSWHSPGERGDDGLHHVTATDGGRGGRRWVLHGDRQGRGGWLGCWGTTSRGAAGVVLVGGVAYSCGGGGRERRRGEVAVYMRRQQQERRHRPCGRACLHLRPTSSMWAVGGRD